MSQLIRIYGDSLSMPRAFIGVPYARTYAEQVAAACEQLWSDRVHLYNRARFDATIAMVAEDYRRDSLNFGTPGGRVLILQCGVCDCAPRPIPLGVRRAIGYLPPVVRGRVIEGIHKNRANLQRIRLWRNTDPALFTARYKGLLEQAADQFEQIYVINVAPTNEQIEAHSPGFVASIDLYNSLIADAIAGRPNIQLVDVHTAITSAPEHVDHYVVRDDGHHITAAGHDLYAKLIIDRERARAGSR